MNELLCSTCNVCSFMPEQSQGRILAIDNEEVRPLVLVIDDAPHVSKYGDALDMAHKLLGGKIDFTYTTTIRCNHRPGKLSMDDSRIALSRCSVWTNSLLDNRLVIISTVRGLAQMKLEEKHHKEGHMFRSGRLGIILCIRPLNYITGAVEGLYTTKTQRILREAGLI